MNSLAVEETGTRVDKLSTASLRKVIDPDLDLPGTVGSGMVLPEELLSVADLDLELSADQWARLSREELASVFDAGIRFEAALMAGFGLMLMRRPDLVDPRSTYILHEIGEETRHSRLFLRVVEQLQPRARNPFVHGLFPTFDRIITGRLLGWPALFAVMVLTGEEVPDLLQKRSSEHPSTDPFVRQVNQYHRMEEARHLSFARMLLPELWASASPADRWWVRYLAPLMMEGTADTMVHPGVYETVGLPAWKTWNAVRKTRSRRQLKADSFRPILAELIEIGAFGTRPRVPRGWQRACMVDSRGRPADGIDTRR